MRFVIAPGTPLAAKPPKWIVAGSLSRRLASTPAWWQRSIPPGWSGRQRISSSAPTASRTGWRIAGFVAAYESVALYGLPLASRRRVNYGPVAPREARDMFIREALIAPEQAAPVRAVVRGEFLEANRRLRAEIERLEAKIRRRDILAGEESAGRILRRADSRAESAPSAISSNGARRRSAAIHGCCYMSRADLMQRDAGEIDAVRFPDALEVGGNMLPLRYRFEPAEADDGVTLVVPDLLLPMRWRRIGWHGWSPAGDSIKSLPCCVSCRKHSASFSCPSRSMRAGRSRS